VSEIKRLPLITYDADGDEIVTFDADHTLRDVFRWLLTQTDRDELLYLAGDVDE
jgi:DNA-directed RNA polymerase subunit L